MKLFKNIFLLGLVAVFLSSCDNDDSTSTNSNLTLNISGLEDLGTDYAYEGWVIVDGEPFSAGVFTVSGDGELSETSFTLDNETLEAATRFVLTIEPSPDSEPDAPTTVRLVAGDFVGSSASISTAATGAVGDFSTASGTYFLRTPTDEVAPGNPNNGNDYNGIWFGTPGAPPTGNFTLPVLSDAWVYEGWIVTENGPISTGTFTDFVAVDSGNPYSGTEYNMGPPVPGEDFFINASNSLDVFPIDLRGKATVISVEPVPDNSPAPFLLKPLSAMIAVDAETAPTSHDFSQNLGTLPTGTVTR